MKLPISLLLLVALGHAASTESAAKGSDAKSPKTKSPETKISASKQTDNSQTSKRELFEGNFGERKDGLLAKYGASGISHGIQYAQDLKDIPPDQSPAHQIFGTRLPQIAKISDVLTGQGPSFEAAVANHLYAPVSVYQARLSSPTLFEVPTPAASQIAYPNQKAYQPRKSAENDKKLQELPTKETELPRVNFNNAPVFAVKQPIFNKQHFESYGPKFSRQQSSLPQDILFQPRQFSKTPASSLFPLVYDQLRPIRYQGDNLPSQFLHQQGVYHLLPVGLSNQEQIRGENPNQGSREELQAEPTQRPKLQNIPAPKQGYHAHPNGAISFASFSQNLPFNMQLEQLVTPQSQAAKPLTQQQLEELSSQYQALVRRPHLQKEKIVPLKQKLQYTPISHKFIQQVPKYQPEPQFITLQQPIQNQIRSLNPLHRLLFQDPPHLTQQQTIQFQYLPAFKPLPQSQLTAESFFQPSNTSPYVPLTHIKQIPKPNGYQDLSTQNPNHNDQQITLVLPQQNLTSLPPLKPNYNQYVKPLDPRTRTSPIFLPTPLQPLPTSTPKLQLNADQLVSSTTIRPDIKDDEKTRAATDNVEIQSQSPTPQPEIIHQSQPTALPLSFQSTTQQPLSTYEAQSEHVQYSTLRPEYQSTIHPQSIQTSPRHEVIIQQQELQELVFEPSPQPSSAPNYQPIRQQQNSQQQQESHQLQSQQLLTELDQLRNQEFQQGLQELLARQYQQGARQLQFLQSIEQIEPQKYQNQHLDSQQHQSQQLYPQQQNEPKQSQLQQNTEKIQSQQNQKHYSETQNQIETTTNPTQDIEKQLEQLQNHQSQSLPQTQHQPDFKTTTGEPHEPQEKAPAPTEPNPTPDFSRFLDPILSPFQPILPEIYTQPQEFVTRPGFNGNFGAPTIPDVQYFGKYAQSLFGH